MASHFDKSIRQRRTEYEYLRTQLRNERSSFESHWRTLGEFIRPRRTRFFVNDVNKGDRRNGRIIDSTGTYASRALTAGLMAGLTSPARQWFQLEPEEPGDTQKQEIKEWNHEVSKLMSSIFSRSNLYKVLPPIYDDLGVFATGCMMVEEDMDTVIRCRSFPIGSYMISTDSYGRVNVFMREFQLTVRQVVDTFGKKEGSSDIDWSNISTSIKSLYEANNTESWVDVVQCIRPNEMYDPNKMESKYKKFSSVYYEQGVSRGTAGNSTVASSDNDFRDKFLRESGYDIFPILAPRWSVTGEDIYGTNCPGMIALGDVKQLQQGERRSLQAMDKQVSPPMNASVQMKNSKATILPGDINYVDHINGRSGFEPSYQVQFDYRGLEGKQEQVRERIRRAFFEDLFFNVTSAKQIQRTAREIDARTGERLLGLGPLVEQANQDLFDPLIDITFAFMERQGLIPDPPEELQGKALKVRYISSLANAQKLVGIEGLDRFGAFVGGVAQFSQDAIDKVDVDELVDEYGEVTSTPPKVIRSNEDAMAIRQQRIQQQAQAQAAETMRQEAAAARDLSQADTTGENALTDMLGAGTQEGQVPQEDELL